MASTGVRGASPAPHLLAGANGLVPQGSQPGLPFDNIYEGASTPHNPFSSTRLQHEACMQALALRIINFAVLARTHLCMEWATRMQFTRKRVKSNFLSSRFEAPILTNQRSMPGARDCFQTGILESDSLCVALVGAVKYFQSSSCKAQAKASVPACSPTNSTLVLKVSPRSFCSCRSCSRRRKRPKPIASPGPLT